jgi:hypothetical protein
MGVMDSLGLGGIGIGTFVPSLEVVGIILVFFFTMMFFLLLVIIFVVRKRKIKLNLFQARAGDSSYRFIPMTAKRTFKEGIAKLKIWRLGIIDKKIPEVENDYLYPDKRGKDTLNLMMDDKGFIHKLKIPKLNEMIDFLVWKQVWKEINNHLELDEGTKKQIKSRAAKLKKDFVDNNKDYEVYMLPNPHETLDMIARQTQKGAQKYGDFLGKYGHMVMIGGAMVVCLIMILFSIIFSHKILGG